MNGLIQGGNGTQGGSPDFLSEAMRQVGEAVDTPELRVPTEKELKDRVETVSRLLAAPTGERKSLLSRMAEGFLDGIDFWSQN